MKPTQEALKSRIHYCPDTGKFTRLFKKGPKPIGGVHTACGQTDYIRMRLLGAKYYGHQLAWLYMTGEWPAGVIDHRDTDGTNNRWDNLRLATVSQNKMNAPIRGDNTSGYKGVHLHKPTGKWIAAIRANNKRIHLGLFLQPKDAARAYNEAAIEHFGEFARINHF